jgi:hypothetical protein
MKPNIGNADKIVRLAAGILIVGFFSFYLSSWWGLIGIIPIFTVFTSRCLFYPLFGINTCGKNEDIKT